MAKIKTYKPLDNDFYHVEEYILESSTGKQEKTGRVFKRTEKIDRNDMDRFTAISRKLQQENGIILFVPPEGSSFAYEIFTQ